MRAAVLVGRRQFALLDAPVPEVGDDEVLIKIAYTGICGSDVHVFNGEQDYPYPVAIGHEITGTVARTGKLVEAFKPGDRVTLLPSESCGQCDFCREGRENLCDNITCIGEMPENGGFAEYIRVKSYMVYAVPDELSLEEAVFIEPAAAAHYIARGVCGRARPESTVGILGMGTIGLLVLQMLKKVFGFRTVHGFDILKPRLNLAVACGADAVHDMNEPFPEDWPRRSFDSPDLYKPGIFDVLVDCAAVPSSLNNAVKLARKAGVVVLVGEPSRPVELDIVTLKLIVLSEVTLVGSMQYVSGDFEAAIGMLKNRRIAIDAMISKVVPLEEIQEGFEDHIAHKSGQIKVLVSS